jgi:protein tyrosine phosphatase (PTP) superfamily phosphohydrolase (DUF442 family)
MVEKESNKTQEQTGKDESRSLKSRIIGAFAAVVFVACLMLLISVKVDSFSANIQRESQVEALAQKAWATEIELPGLENFYKISENLYRGAQPTREGFGQLKELGIKTIVNLRSFHSDRDVMAGRDFLYEHIYMKAWHPEDKEVIRFLEVITDKSKQPVFVHCQHGADRTGTMCAVYRMVIQGWGKDEAIEEMTKGGFGFHSIWWNLENYLRKLDVANMRWMLFMEHLNRWDEELLITFE